MIRLAVLISVVAGMLAVALSPSFAQSKRTTARSSHAAERPAIERAERLDHFFAGLRALEAGSERGLVRVVHLGDSALVADGPTRVVRAALQERFGDGGPGFVVPGTPWKTYERACLDTGGSEGFRIERLPRARLEDGRYGLSGVALMSETPGALAWLASATSGCSARFSRLELFFDRAPGYGRFSVRADGGEKQVLDTAAPAPALGSYLTELGDGTHRVELEAVGDGPVRLYGAALERAGPGIVYEVHGVVGGHARDYARNADREQLVAQLGRRAPDLVIVQFGTNETEDRPYHPEELTRMLGELLARISAAAPQASCLVLTPYDRGVKRRSSGSHENIARAVSEVRAAARAGRCALFDTYEAMGGPGTIARWVRERPPRAAFDRTHLTPLGAQAIGELLTRALLEAYETSVGRY
jgi:lysophospholipase L1-like esterase